MISSILTGWMIWQMTGLKVTIKQKPVSDELEKRLQKIGRKLSDFIGVHKEASILLDRWVQKNFKDEGQSLGADSWPPFARGGRWRRGFGLDTAAKLLQDTGRLRISFTPFSSAKTAGIGSDLSYAEPHEEGKGSLPQRRMLPKAAEVQDALIELFERHVREGLRNAQR